MVVQPGPHGLGEHDQSGVPPEEIRFGVAMNGGLRSPSGWVGSPSSSTASSRLAGDRGPTQTCCASLRTARVDVRPGTSAGGVNGAALALAQVNRRPDLPRCATSGWSRPHRGVAAPAVPRSPELAAQG